MRGSKRVIAVAVALAVAQEAAYAASKQGEQEEDSVYRWGRWRVLTPAAGLEEVGIRVPQQEIEARPEDAEEYARKLSGNERGVGEKGGDVPVTEGPLTEGPCKAGASCGYATYRRAYNGEFVQDPLDAGPEPARFDLRFDADGGEGSITGSFDVTGVEDERYPDRHSVDPMKGSRDFLGLDDSEGYEYFLDEDEEGHLSEIDPGIQIPEAQGVGHFSPRWRDMIRDSGYEGCYGIDSCFEDEARGEFVYGVTSPADDLEALNAGNVTAVYQGFTLGDAPVPVEIEVSFGSDPTWSGSWNRGRDGVISTFTDSRGQLYVEGEVGFEATGHVSGPNIISDSVSAKDGTVSGTVKGSFIGQATGSVTETGAPYLIGISDIVKTKVNGVETAVDGSEGSGGYVKARNVSTFATSRKGVGIPIGDLD